MDDNTSDFTESHGLQCNLPAWHYFAKAKFDLNRTTFILGRIKNSTVSEFTDEVGNDSVSWLCSSSIFTLLD